MGFRPGMPDHIRRAILSGDTELLRRAGTKASRVRSANRRKEQERREPVQLDRMQRASGEKE